MFVSKKNLIESIRSIEYNERRVFTHFWRKTHGIFDLSRMRRKVECIPEMGSDILQGRIEGAIQKGRMWFIPVGTEKPIDPRKARKLEQNKSH